MWIGLLWYFNFVQIPNMAKIPDEQKPAIGKVIAPAALFYFRWAAALTVLSGLILAYLNGYLHDAMTLSIGSGFQNIQLLELVCGLELLWLLMFGLLFGLIKKEL